MFVCPLPQVTQLTSNVGLNTDQVSQTMLLLGKRGTGFRLEAAIHKALFAFSGFFWVLVGFAVFLGMIQLWTFGKVGYMRH